MPHIDVAAPAADPADQSRSTALPRAAAFDRQEWEIVELARRDSLASLRDPTRAERFVARLFGATISRRLANPRLEALRRLAVLAWHYSYAVPVSAIKSFKAAGFSVDQLEILLARIAASRIVHGRSAHA